MSASNLACLRRLTRNHNILVIRLYKLVNDVIRHWKPHVTFGHVEGCM